MPVFNSISGGVFFVRNAVVKFGGGCSVELSLRGFSAVLSRAEGEGKGGEFSEGLLRIFAGTVSCLFSRLFGTNGFVSISYALQLSGKMIVNQGFLRIVLSSW